MTKQTDNISTLIDVLKAENAFSDDVRQAVVDIIIEHMVTSKEKNRLDKELKRVAVFFERSVGPDGKEWPANWWKPEDFEGHPNQGHRKWRRLVKTVRI